MLASCRPCFEPTNAAYDQLMACNSCNPARVMMQPHPQAPHEVRRHAGGAHGAARHQGVARQHRLDGRQVRSMVVVAPCGCVYVCGEGGEGVAALWPLLCGRCFAAAEKWC